MKDKLDISDQDVYEAMREIEGYIDISMSDFRELYEHTYKHAVKRILHSTRLDEIMTSDVISVTEQTGMPEIIRAMASGSISGLPVVDAENHVVGVVSEKDIFRALGGKKDVGFWDILTNCMEVNKCLLRSVAGQTAGEIMSSPAITLKVGDSAQDAVRLFKGKAINRLPVVDEDNILEGIVTRTDLLHAHLNIDEQ
ncbi:MAG: CBS domain-containing protein [Desulfopila sp.]|jgi:CBS-domain-containing membrane protein|nr:CBS domain-containing protein [Desulfopila sp.]